MPRKAWLAKLLIYLTLLLAVWKAGAVQAHEIQLIRSEPPDGAELPQAPDEVAAWFNEELETDQSTLKVFDSAGAQVDLGDGGVDLTDPEHASLRVSLPSGLMDGTYQVRWVAVIYDGDSAEGSFSFTVGENASAGSDPNQAATGELTTRITYAIAGLVGAFLIGGLLYLLRRSRPA